ncbi:MAG TPA: hypothetical protein VK249_16715 [Anaerolineales bacterium]|nr:hypothetical protein [Anaerolineales bacterium]
MTALQLNPNNTDTIKLDPQTSSWLSVIERNSDKGKTCMVPKHYFEVLFTWGYVEGTFAAAKLSATGRARLLGEKMQPKEEKKPKTKKK